MGRIGSKCKNFLEKENMKICKELKNKEKVFLKMRI